MIEELFFFTLGAFSTFLFCLYYYHKNDIPYLLATIKEDVNNLHITVHHMFDAMKK